MSDDPRRQLPSVDRLLREAWAVELLQLAPRTVVVESIRDAISSARATDLATADWEARVRAAVQQRTRRSLQPVLNATGVVLHTNLGRAPLARAAVEAIASVATGYSNLEFDLATGGRGHRSDHCRALLAELTGATDGFAVNNAAGALVLALNALAEGREVIISRGELIEIGGSFRIPDIMARSGAVLREVGTTNRTHLEDYARAITLKTGAILTVHRSNFEQHGFVTTPGPAELARLAHSRDLPYIHDVGSGLLADLALWGLTTEPRVPDAVASGADLVLFSGDKLLGGPQAGCLVGSTAAVGAARSNPLARALRADKLTLAALEATLALYRDAEVARHEIPVLAMLTASAESLRARAARIAAGAPTTLQPEVITGESAVGGGSFPGAVLPTALVALTPTDGNADRLAERLRQSDPPVIARIQDGRVVIDPRTLLVGQDDRLAVMLSTLSA